MVCSTLGSPTWTGHLAPALVDVAERRASGTLHAVNAGEATWHALAIEALNRARISTRVVAVTTEEFPRPALRPAYSVQFFVKAFRQGDPELAGVAGYRLVQVPLG